MNIMFFDATREWSGGANRLFLCCRELVKRGHHVVVCSLPGNEMSKRLAQEGIPMFTLEPRSDVNLLVVPEILRKMREHDIDIIDIHSPKFYWLGALAGRLSGKPVLITRNVPFRKKGLKRKLNKLLYGLLADRVVAISDKIKRELLEDYRIDGRSVDVVYDGLDTERFEMSRSPKDNSNVTVGVVSRLVFGKGLECFVEAMPKIVREIPEVRFVIAGSGPLENDLRRRVIELGLGNSVVFAGFRHDIPQLYGELDITVIPSPEEGMSMSALESMASGGPVVATSGGGLVDIITNMHNGVIVPPDNPEALASGVVALLRADYRTIGLNAKKTVKEKFELHRIIDRYESLIASLVPKSR
ncbi:MAG: glycosyltransferase family 4 protein [Chlorobiaceae bacterium]|nr:glycosyltransferase family 4 protein [Chlorobiaceae bacterium]